MYEALVRTLCKRRSGGSVCEAVCRARSVEEGLCARRCVV